MTARRRAAAWAGAVTLGWSALMLALYFAIAALRPDWGYAATATATLAGLALVLVVWLWRGGLWAAAGLARVRPDRPALLILPLLLALVPLAAGVAPVEAPILAVMVAGYALTGFVEEGMFRGILLDRLRPQGEHFAAAVTAVLFGLMHLGNILMRGQLAPILGQVVGAACFGFGYAALRLRTGTLWPLVGLHALTDLMLHLGRLPLIPVAVAQDVVLLGLGLWLLRRPALPPDVAKTA